MYHISPSLLCADPVSYTHLMHMPENMGLMLA